MPPEDRRHYQHSWDELLYEHHLLSLLDCHGNIGPGKIGPAGPILDTKTGPAGPNLVDQV